MTATQHETPDLHDLWVDNYHDTDDGALRALPTPSTPGYTVFTDYKGRKWTCCVCLAEWLTWFQKVCIKRGWIRSGLDIAQLTGDASASAGTHSGGGVFDLILEIDDRFVLLARDRGATGTWRRYKSQGFWADHLHGCLRGCPHLAASAATQVKEELYGPPAGVAPKRGGDGLVGQNPDPHRDPSPYMDWSAGVTLMKKELGALAKDTTTSLMVAPNPSLRQHTAAVRGAVAPAAAGTYTFEYLPTGTTTWRAFKTAATTGGPFAFDWRFGSATQDVRVRFTPKDPLAFKPSTSPVVKVATIALADLVTKATQTPRDADQDKTIADLAARVKRLEDTQPPPEEPSLPSEPLFGADFSRFQTDAQWQAFLADDDKTFVIHKATEGIGVDSAPYPARRDDSRREHLLLGAYHLGWLNQDVEQEANHFLGYAQLRPGEVPCLDVEDWGVTDPSNPRYAQDKAMRDSVSWPERVTWVLEWLRLVGVALSARCLFYAPWSYVQGLRGGATVAQWETLTESGLWLADPTGVPGKHDPVDAKTGSTKTLTVVVHQYATKPYDLNYLPGGHAAWDAYAAA